MNRLLYVIETEKSRIGRRVLFLWWNLIGYWDIKMRQKTNRVI